VELPNDLAFPEAPTAVGDLELDSLIPAPALSPLEAVVAEAAEEVAVPAFVPDKVSRTLAPFFQKGYQTRKEARELMDPRVRQEAEERLQRVGLTLAWSPYSRYYGLALADTPEKQERITNLSELDRNALALLVILWARLVLPQRLAAEGREGGVSDPSVSFEALNAEFGKKLGGRRFEMYIAQLKRLGFLDYTRKDDIKAGPFLDLLGDANELASYLRQSTLAKVLAEAPAAVTAPADPELAIASAEPVESESEDDADETLEP
jgi:hypothetical protein